MAALPIRIPEKVLAWRERQRKGTIMRPRTFKRITKEARKRYGRKRAGPATGGKAYWITTLRKYLDSHPGDLAATRALRKLIERRYKRTKNPSIKELRRQLSKAHKRRDLSHVYVLREKIKAKQGLRRNPPKRWYVGSRKPDRKKVVFTSSSKPTERSHGVFFYYVTGPFKSREEAERSARYHSA